MALHDYQCVECGSIKRDVYVPISVGASAATVYCPACELDLGRSVRCEPIPAIGSMSIFSDAVSRSSPHDRAKSTAVVEDPASPSGYRTVTVDSLATIRKLERESEQRERNGEGRRMVWRDFSQDASNRDRHTLGQDPSLKPPKTFSNGQPVVARKGTPVMADHGTVED